MADPIKIDGLAAFSRNLKKLDNELPKALRIAMNGAANLVVNDARPRVPRRTGRAQSTIKARSTRTAVRVAMGGTKAPYMPWLDFGGRVGRGRSVVRPFIKDGRYVYRSYFKLRDSGDIQTEITRALLGVAAQAGVVVD